MVAITGGFDATKVDPSVGFPVLPAGQYKAVIIDSDEVPNKSGNGSHMKLQIQVIEGDQKGRTLFVHLNLNNPNATAVSIARAELSAICRAVNVMSPQDTCQLHDIPMGVEVGLAKRKDTGEPENVVKGYTALVAGVQPGGAAPQAGGGGSGMWST